MPVPHDTCWYVAVNGQQSQVLAILRYKQWGVMSGITVTHIAGTHVYHTYKQCYKHIHVVIIGYAVAQLADDVVRL